MPDSSRNEILPSIFGIAHATSIRGEGLSIADALGRVDYAAVRSQLRISEIAEVLRANPQIVEDWVLYCEDKRTDGGWYLDSENLEIGELGIPSSLRTFQTLEEAVAGYILAELDSVAQLDGQA